jgi:hypothetical protein
MAPHKRSPFPKHSQRLNLFDAFQNLLGAAQPWRLFLLKKRRAPAMQCFPTADQGLPVGSALE